MFSSELQEVKKILLLTHLEICVFPEWGSQNPQHRKLIHQDIENKKIDANSFSISHTKNLGGFIWSTNENIHLGFDIEVTDRVTEQIARRVCETEQEFNLAPDPASLWCAKEAVFKSLKNLNQPKLISQIQITNWKKQNLSQYESFSANYPGTGGVFHKNFYTFCVFQIKAQL